jgi:hypothetical protein
VRGERWVHALFWGNEKDKCVFGGKNRRGFKKMNTNNEPQKERKHSLVSSFFSTIPRITQDDIKDDR